ncbi:MAG: phage major capsid protein, partial [Pseudomonadota bacterium]
PGVQAQDSATYDYDAHLDALQLIETANFLPSGVAHPPVLARSLRGLTDANNQYLAPPADLVEVPRMVTTRLPDDAAIFGDFREMVIGVRSQFSLMISQHARMERDTILIAARWRGDIGIARPKALVNITVTG